MAGGTRVNQKLHAAAGLETAKGLLERVKSLLERVKSLVTVAEDRWASVQACALVEAAIGAQLPLPQGPTAPAMATLGGRG